MMSELFCDLISTDKIVIYLDNVLIFTKDLCYGLTSPSLFSIIYLELPLVTVT
jgi:hypothetical protein